MLLSVIDASKGGNTVGWFEYVAATLLNPDEVRAIVVVVVLVACIVTLVVEIDVGCTENYNDRSQKVFDRIGNRKRGLQHLKRYSEGKRIALAYSQAFMNLIITFAKV